MRKHVKIARTWWLGISLVAAGVGAQAFEMDRTHLPIAEPDAPKFKELDVRGVEAPPLFSVKAPEGAPNVIIVLIDDVGFGATTPFGGPINTPTMDRLAAGGLRYNNFHTTALCSPTRNALKTGQPPPDQYRLHHGERDRVSGQHRKNS
jgi:arylsulfatase